MGGVSTHSPQRYEHAFDRSGLLYAYSSVTHAREVHIQYILISNFDTSYWFATATQSFLQLAQVLLLELVNYITKYSEIPLENTVRK